MDVNPVYDPNRKHVVSFDTANSLDAEKLGKFLKPENALPLSEIKFKDLAIYPGIGIYLLSFILKVNLFPLLPLNDRKTYCSNKGH